MLKDQWPKKKEMLQLHLGIRTLYNIPYKNIRLYLI